MRTETQTAISQIWECLYDHGAGKYKGAASKAQRAQAVENLEMLELEIKTLRAQIASLTSQTKAQKDSITSYYEDRANGVHAAKTP